jgi:hypothetical protein
MCSLLLMCLCCLFGQSKSFNCTYDNQSCILFIDVHKGFILMHSETNVSVPVRVLTLLLVCSLQILKNKQKETLWSYQFAQLKTSTDDNKTKVQFYFQDPLTKRIEVKVGLLK